MVAIYRNPNSPINGYGFDITLKVTPKTVFFCACEGGFYLGSAIEHRAHNDGSNLQERGR